MIDYGKAFSFFTADERWLEKLGIGVGVFIGSVLAALLVAIVPSFILYAILPWPVAANIASGLVYYLSIVLLVGYGLRLMQNVRNGVEQPLPYWNDWGNDLIRGFKLVIVALIWALPLLIFAIPSAIGTAMTNNYENATSFFGGMLLLCGGCLTFLYTLFLAVASPGYTQAFLHDEQIQSGLRFEAIFRWTRQNLSPVVTVAIVTFLATIILFFLGVIAGPILLCVGWIITLPLGVLLPLLVQYHLYGQLARAYPLDFAPPAIVTNAVAAPAAEDVPPAAADVTPPAE